MDTILLILSTTREAPKTVAYALEQTRTCGGRLEALMVLDDKLGQDVFRKLTHEGFMGEGPSSDCANSLLKEYEQRAEHRMNLLEGNAQQAGISFCCSIRKGDVAEICLQVIKELKPKEVIVNRIARSRLSRFIFSSAVDKIKTHTSVPVTVIEEVETA